MWETENFGIRNFSEFYSRKSGFSNFSKISEFSISVPHILERELKFDCLDKSNKDVIFEMKYVRKTYKNIHRIDYSIISRS